MLAQWIRVFYSNNGVLTDYSLAAQDTDAIPFPIVAAEDYLYIAQYFPFNNFYLELNTVNSLASVMTVQYWYGKEWVNAVDLIDATKVNGVSLAKGGVVQFSPSRRYKWQEIVDTKEEQGSLLTSLEIYNNYWLRVKFSSDLSLTTALESVGYKFTNDDMLSAIDSEINNYLLAWGGVGKLDWNEQIVLASQYLIYDLKSKGLIIHPGNILRFDDVSLACAHRALMIIYAQLGESFLGKYNYSLGMYNELMSIKRFNFDVDLDGRLDKQEISNSVGKLIR